MATGTGLGTPAPVPTPSAPGPGTRRSLAARGTSQVRLIRAFYEEHVCCDDMLRIALYFDPAVAHIPEPVAVLILSVPAGVRETDPDNPFRPQARELFGLGNAVVIPVEPLTAIESNSVSAT